MTRLRKVLLGTAIPVALSLIASSAFAECTTLGYSVNDYGKDGPTKDAKDLLDKYIATWTAERGIKKYTTGKKEVTCELFLNFIVFDEHTCKATATVCWSGGPSAGTPKSGPEKAKPAAKGKDKS